ncbi:MAG: P1 family peptidase [Alphaproteobacteria bacterium]|nr:P1 family peptidase [Alphaproteobacteria bacterium]
MIDVGDKNLITDVPGIKVGHANSSDYITGTTVLVGDTPMIAAVDCRGGAPGTHETDVLLLESTVQKIDAIVLSGGSAFGLESVYGVMKYLRQLDRGFKAATSRVPIVPAAVIFDLIDGSEKKWNQKSPYQGLGLKAIQNASTMFNLGNNGAGLGAKAGLLKGGLGSASYVVNFDNSRKITLGALVVVNSYGSVVIPGTSCFWSFPFEHNNEFGGQIFTEKSSLLTDDQNEFKQPFSGTNTTLAIIATDAMLTKTQARRLAIMAQDGLARAIRPIHTAFDGDIVFAVSTGQQILDKVDYELMKLGMYAADCLSRAVARGVYMAKSVNGYQSYRDFYKI